MKKIISTFVKPAFPHLSTVLSMMAGSSILLAMHASADDQVSVNKGVSAAQSVEQITPDNESWAWSAQLTNITQGHSKFASPYAGANSLIANGRTEETTDITLFAGVRLWRGAEFWLNPEIDQGFGLSNTLGVAGYPSGGAYKLGQNKPYIRLPRAFIRQTLSLGGTDEAVPSGVNQLSGTRTQNNVVLTVGRYAVVDIFDTNTYAHDPRADFLNWSIIESGAFDYAADVWGYTNGATIEWNQDNWSLRGAVFQLSPEPNSKIAGIHTSQYSVIAEFERRHEWQNHPGKIKLLGFVNRAKMSRYKDAVQLGIASNAIPDASLTRRFGSNTGFAFNAEQEITSDVGAFARFSMNAGDKEAYEFTDINRSLAMGLSIKGDRWNRHDDTVGIAFAVNGLSSDAKRYFKAGGLGVLIGDGDLNYGNEKIFESYYSFKLHPHVSLSVDYQRVTNPAYNKDRGPVSLFGLRLHADM
ncbi:carbohydrate porin [Undibacterium sp. Jales W-56]|uniref:carbohydrate porin n=1 Tax=Undibacterium sp. Jales W-56 TaxID=2897325 RepID=UPI0021D207C6|nr:carbohydrate porin [Undibacterium sp. Jales W-56]MCU6433982.1 carbohydrate porin [Undibacterium sp. Jales W-56]